MATTIVRGAGAAGVSQLKNIANADVDAAAAIATSKLADAANFILRGGSVPFTADQSMGSHKLTSVTDPTAAQDAATKAYVDAARVGLAVKAPVEGATTAALTACTAAGTGVGKTLTKNANGSFNSEAIDGVTFVVGDRVLVKNQVTQANNGIYTITTLGTGSVPWVLTRATDFDEVTEVAEGSFVLIIEGTTLAATQWVQTQDVTTVDTDAMVFAQFAAGTTYSAGNGLELIGSSFDVKLDGTSLAKSASGLKLTDLTNTHILVGDGSNHAQDVALSGDVTITNAGVATVANQIKSSKYIVRETPSGTINGSTTAFTLANTPVAGTESVYLNGILQEPGAGNDYTISGLTITYLTAPLSGDRLRVSYISS